MIRIFFADLGSFDEKAALMLVSPARREKALAISDDGARRQSLGAALLLHSVFGRSDCSVTKNGKPFFAGSDAHFSLAHCRGTVVCAVSDAPVGVDIELERQNGIALARRWFAPDEAMSVENAADPNEEFCIIWTVKESYIKLRGLRLSDMSRFSVNALDAQYRSLRLGEYHLACCADGIDKIELLQQKI
mgnify:CR=1 FL=1